MSTTALGDNLVWRKKKTGHHTNITVLEIGWSFYRLGTKQRWQGALHSMHFCFILGFRKNGFHVMRNHLFLSTSNTQHLSKREAELLLSNFQSCHIHFIWHMKVSEVSEINKLCEAYFHWKINFFQPNWMESKPTCGCAGCLTAFKTKSSSGLTTYGLLKNPQMKKKLSVAYQVNGRQKTVAKADF